VISARPCKEITLFIMEGKARKGISERRHFREAEKQIVTAQAREHLR
jgi:hypothetical protein